MIWPKDRIAEISKKLESSNPVDWNQELVLQSVSVAHLTGEFVRQACELNDELVSQSLQAVGRSIGVNLDSVESQ